MRAGLHGELTEEQAHRLFAQGEDAVTFALLALSQKIAGKKHPNAPSGSVPPFEKPNKKEPGKKPGQRPGHLGSRRAEPVEVDQRAVHALVKCPDCQSQLGEPLEERTRIIEDLISEAIKVIATEHTITRYYCASCNKIVEPKVPDALPRCRIGNHILSLTAWLHYGLGQTISQIAEVLNYHLRFKLSPAGLLQMWHRLAEILYPWYEQIGEEAKKSAVLNADETGWRLDGVTHWLWCFCNEQATYYMIAASRGAEALLEFFTEEFKGTLITDFWGAYNKIECAARQVCLAHLCRDLKAVDLWNHSAGWMAFRQKLKRLLSDAMRLSLQKDYGSPERESKRARLDFRLREITETDWGDKQARRLVKRLNRHQNDMFTFVDQPAVMPDNNQAEREIRPAVIIRKNSLGNRSEKGADTQAALMSIYRTLRRRGHNPVQEIIKALRAYILSDKLPPLPS